MKKIKIGIIGAGNIIKKHIHAIKANKKKFILESICDSDKNKIIELKKLDKKLNLYNNIEDFYKHSNADLVALLTPSGMHFSQIIRLSKKFKSLIVEKPMVMNFNEARKIISHFNRNNKNLFIVKQNRFNPSIIELKKAIDQKRFGKIFLATIRLRWNRNKNYFMKDSWRGTWKYDGGVLANQASHHIDLLQWLVGDVKSVISKTIRVVKASKVPDTCVCLLKFKNGSLGVIEATTGTQPKNLEGSISILGNNGTACIGGFAASKIDTWEFNKKLKKDKKIIKKINSLKDNFASGHTEFYKNVFAYLKNKKNDVTTYQDGAKSIKIIDKIYASAELSKEVFLNDNNFSKNLGIKK